MATILPRIDWQLGKHRAECTRTVGKGEERSFFLRAPDCNFLTRFASSIHSFSILKGQRRGESTLACLRLLKVAQILSNRHAKHRNGIVLIFMSRDSAQIPSPFPGCRERRVQFKGVPYVPLSLLFLSLSVGGIHVSASLTGVRPATEPGALNCLASM